MNITDVARNVSMTSLVPSVRGMLQRKCACGSHTSMGGECKECAAKKGMLQRKLMIGASNDPLEQEADRVADQVMSTPLTSAINRTPPKIQRLTGQASDGLNTAPPSVEQVLASPGRPLEPALRQEMEQRFGHDFSRVRVHSGVAAEQSARGVSAKAYTVGHNIVFGTGQFIPETRRGKKLLAHELTHVVQQANTTERAHTTSSKVSIAQGSPKHMQRYGHDVQSCKEEDLVNILWPSDHLAREWVNEAIADLNLIPLPEYIPPLFKCYFGKNTPKLETIKGNIGTIKNTFQANNYFYVCRYDCESSKESSALGMTKVSWLFGGSGPIILCMNNLNTQIAPTDVGAQTIIHEFAHRYLDFSGDNYCDGCCQGINPDAALKNPDSYAGFIRDLHFKKISIARKKMIKK